MFCFKKICIHRPTQTPIVHKFLALFDMIVFYDWPFQHVYFAKNVAFAYSYIISL